MLCLKYTIFDSPLGDMFKRLQPPPSDFYMPLFSIPIKFGERFGTIVPPPKDFYFKKNQHLCCIFCQRTYKFVNVDAQFDSFLKGLVEYPKKNKFIPIESEKCKYCRCRFNLCGYQDKTFSPSAAERIVSDVFGEEALTTGPLYERLKKSTPLVNKLVEVKRNKRVKLVKFKIRRSLKKMRKLSADAPSFVPGGRKPRSIQVDTPYLTESKQKVILKPGVVNVK